MLKKTEVNIWVIEEKESTKEEMGSEKMAVSFPVGLKNFGVSVLERVSC